MYGVLELHLSDKYGTNGTSREFLAGAGKGKYSVADVRPPYPLLSHARRGWLMMTIGDR